MSSKVKWAERLLVPLRRIREPSAVLLTSREMAPLQLSAGCNLPWRVPFTCPVLVLRCLGKRVGMRRIEDMVWTKEEREVRGNVGGGEKEGEQRKEMERERETGREGTERRELRAKRKDGMGIWEGEAGGREGKEGAGKKELENLKLRRESSYIYGEPARCHTLS